MKRYKDQRHVLSKIGFKNHDTSGRKDWETDRDMNNPINVVQATNNPFALDLVKINESKAFRRLYGQTQVFSNPSNPNVRNRATHTLSVAGIAQTIGDYLGFNVDLLRAGAYGHDIGHVIFGHNGETWFEKKLRERYKNDKIKFKHSINSIIVAQRVERKGLGLNLSYETLQLIFNHSGGDNPICAKKGEMQEISVLIFSDKVGYVAHDISDSFRYGIIDKNNIPECMVELAGITNKKQISAGNLQHGIVDNCINWAVQESLGKGCFSFHESKIARLFREARDWMFENVYYKVNRELQHDKLDLIFKYLSKLKLSIYQGIDPLFAMIPMVDWDCERIDQAINYNNDNLDQFGFNEIVREFPKEKITGFFDFDTIDLNPKHFSKISL
jgi:dGTPase